MALSGTEILQVLGVQANGQPAATTEQTTTQAIANLATTQAPFGGGTAILQEQGQINAQIGNPLTNPATITNDNVLAIYTIPANSFNAAGVGVEITAMGSFPLTDTQAKRCKLIWNPLTAVVGSAVTTTAASALLGDTGSTTNSGAPAGWLLNSQVFKYGAAGSNTQIGQEIATIIGSTHGGMGLPAALTTNESASVLACVTGNATSSVGDIALYFFDVVGMNP